MRDDLQLSCVTRDIEQLDIGTIMSEVEPKTVFEGILEMGKTARFVEVENFGMWARMWDTPNFLYRY